MNPLIKDYLTGKKSWTVTGLTLTFLINALFWGYAIYLLITDVIYDQVVDLGYMLLVPLALFAGLHWNKRFRMTRSGLEFMTDDDTIS